MAENKTLLTVIELPEFIKQALKCMSEENREEFISYIAANPLEGDLIQSTGGARKIRWATNSGRGKSGGARVIYYFYDTDLPIFLFTAYGKNQKANLSMNEKNALKKIIKLIVQEYKGEFDE